MKTVTADPAIGAHISASGGLTKLWQRAQELGVEVIQLHPTAPQNFRQANHSDQELAKLRQEAQAQRVPIYFHSIYLINLANLDDKLWHASIGSVRHYLELAARLGARGSITHVGSHKGAGLRAVTSRLKKAAVKIAAQPGEKQPISGTGTNSETNKPPYFIIENTAGGGGTLGRDIDELSTLYHIFSSALPTKICLDTCHLFAAGVPLHDAAKWQLWLEKFDQEIGLQAVIAVHLNDSQTDFGSNRDRHANLGEGKIGLDNLRRVVREPKLRHCDFILEVPGAGRGPDKDNIELAKSLRLA